CLGRVQPTCDQLRRTTRDGGARPATLRCCAGRLDEVRELGAAESLGHLPGAQTRMREESPALQEHALVDVLLRVQSCRRSRGAAERLRRVADSALVVLDATGGRE